MDWNEALANVTRGVLLAHAWLQQSRSLTAFVSLALDYRDSGWYLAGDQELRRTEK
jgi:hypothetical protein